MDYRNRRYNSKRTRENQQKQENNPKKIKNKRQPRKYKQYYYNTQLTQPNFVSFKDMYKHRKIFINQIEKILGLFLLSENKKIPPTIVQFVLAPIANISSKIYNCIQKSISKKKSKKNSFIGQEEIVNINCKELQKLLIVCISKFLY